MLSGRHEAAAAELAAWAEDVRQPGVGARAVLLAAPPGWGRTAVLDQLAAVLSAAGAPATLLARVSGRSLPDGPGVQALVLRDCLMEAGVRRRAAELLCLDRLGGAAQRGQGARSLFASGLAAAVSFLLAGLAAGAGGAARRAGRAEDDGPAGENGAVARAARAVAAVSASAPVVVLIDDADSLEPDLAVTLIEKLIDRHDSRVLVVAAVNPGSGLASALTSRARYGLTAGRVHRAGADPRMGYKSRADLAGELCPALPPAAIQRIARRTRTFAEVFAAAGSVRLAAAVLDEAAAIAADPRTGVADRVVAAQAAHRVRGDLDDRDRLRQAQRQLTWDLEALGDLPAALGVAAAALAQCPPGDRYQDDREELSAAVLRLSRTVPAAHEDPLVAEMIAAAAAGGAAAGLAALG
jgi:hypothetical protein